MPSVCVPNLADVTISGNRDQSGVVLCGSIFDGRQLEGWTFRIDAYYRTLEAARHQDGPETAGHIAPSGRFVPTASSFTLGTVFTEDDFRALFAGIRGGPAGAWIREELQNEIVCDVDQAWVRRQYAPGNYPPLHAPHGWHQDGALGFDFLAHQDGGFPADSLLPMVTCWIALGSCGEESPGLELVMRRIERLVAPSDLIDERVRARFEPMEFSRPAMGLGDALLFRGDILHRTHVTPAMTKDRTSIELRFFPADNVPVRLKGDRFMTVS